MAQFHSLECRHAVVPAPYFDNTILFPLNSLGILVENVLTKDIQIYLWTLSSISLTYMSIFMLVPDCPDYCFAANFEIEKIVLLFLIPSQFQINFRITCQYLQRSKLGF